MAHGSLVYLAYTEGARAVVTPTLTGLAAAAAARPYGARMTVRDMVAKQTRVERQEAPDCASVSFDSGAANAFQSYVRQALNFSVARCGDLYGVVEADGSVKVHAVFEPPQQGSVAGVTLQRDAAEEERVAFIAQRLGLSKVGWIFSPSTAVARDVVLTSSEILAMAERQAAGGEHFVTAVASLVSDEEGTLSVHFEAFQCSRQAVQLFSDGWLVPGEDAAFVATNMAKDVVIVAGRDMRRIENEFLITTVPIKDHTGPLATGFPVENRLTGQTVDELRGVLNSRKSTPFAQRIADFHLLLFLASRLDLKTDMGALCDAVRTGACADFFLIECVFVIFPSHTNGVSRAGGEVSEGYCLLINSIAGIH